MAIQIKEPPEPNSRSALCAVGRPIMIGSDALRRLTQELRGYCRGHHEGRSILIAGHRGAGKTTLVHAAMLEVLREQEVAEQDQAERDPHERQLRAAERLCLALASSGGNPTEDAFDRPMLVLLQGPALLPPLSVAAPAAVPAQALATTPTPAPTVVLALTAPAAPAPAAPPPARPHPTEESAEMALRSITLALYRAAAREFSRRFTARTELAAARAAEAAAFDVPPPVDPREARELSAQFELELDEFPGQARLASLWRRSVEMEAAALGAEESGLRRELAERELLALLSIGEARRVVGGKLSTEEQKTTTAESKTEQSFAREAKADDFWKPLTAVLAGGATGAGLQLSGATSGPATALAGLFGVLGMMGLFKFSASSSRSRAVSRKELFIPDRTVATLEQVLPVLIERLRAAGCAPVFLVDELDKVENLENRFGPLLGRLKKLVAERAFFCFVADRSYFESLRAQSDTRSYSQEYTFFTQHLFVTYSPADYHEYFRQMLGLDEPDGLAPPASPAGVATVPSPTPPPP